MQPHYNKQPDLYVSQVNTDVYCYHCGSNSYIKQGKTSSEDKKQIYKCKTCKKVFVEGRTQSYKAEYEDCDDVWSAEALGISIPKHRHQSKIVFFKIKHPWLKYHVKKFIKYMAASGRHLNTITGYTTAFNDFSRFLLEQHYSLKDISEINRQLILDYLSYLKIRKIGYSQTTRRLGTLKMFFELGLVNQWFKVPPYLILDEDYPKEVKTIPRYIPEEVLRQLNQHLDYLPDSVMRMVLVIQECGLRVGELCQLEFNCLKYDADNNGYIQFMRGKILEEQTIPITPELVKVIQEQQQYIRENLGSGYEYLFCARKAVGSKGAGNKYIKEELFAPTNKILSAESFINYLKRLANEFEIKDNNGRQWNFQSHQFRHSVGTRMINNGVPLHIIQRYLGHKSPTMTQRYAYIYDETLRKEIEKYHESKVVNFQGDTSELDETILSSNNDLEWFKKNVQARALEHGYCARPKVLGNCDIPGFDGCYNCPHWRTNKNFLPVLKDTLERTNNVLQKAKNCGWELQVNKNTPIKDNLEKVIKSLEEDND